LAQLFSLGGIEHRVALYRFVCLKGAVTIIALVVVILVSAIFGYRAIFPSAPQRAGVVKTVAEGRMIAKSGMDYLSQLRTEGLLPGVATNEHGNAAISGRLSFYPYSLTVRFTKAGEVFTNNYTIVQIKKDLPWQLKRAWQTGSNGQIIQEWTVK
jgi:hypothetical protein